MLRFLLDIDGAMMLATEQDDILGRVEFYVGKLVFEFGSPALVTERQDMSELARPGNISAFVASRSDLAALAIFASAKSAAEHRAANRFRCPVGHHPTPSRFSKLTSESRQFLKVAQVRHSTQMEDRPVNLDRFAPVPGRALNGTVLDKGADRLPRG
jgi:hypothetical protein